MTSQTFVILPAGCIFNDRTKIKLKEVIQNWDNGTVIVCEKPNGQLGFIAGCSGEYGVKVGQTVECIHDQTRARMGYWKVLNQVAYEDVGGVFTVKGALLDNVNLEAKGTIAVFK